jgi:autotransporter translocation and assembly factor TamB
MIVQKLALGYLKPFGFVEDSNIQAQGRLVISGDPASPEIDGTLSCDAGSFTAPAVFSDLKLAEGRMEFKGNKVKIDATLNDIAGAALVVAGEAVHAKLAPETFSLAFSAPAAIRVDGLPRLFKGSAKGSVRFEGTIERPVLKGEVTLLEGRLQSPPKRQKGNTTSILDRLEWDLKVRFGDAVDYAVEPVEGAAIKLARLSSRSLIIVKGAGEEMKLYGEVTADSGPLTLFMGKRLWKKAPAE